MEEILRVENLKKYFVKKQIFGSKTSTVRATDDVSFSVSKGEVFVLAGESGSGKSTIAKIILKSILADSGKIIFDGTEIGNDENIFIVASCGDKGLDFLMGNSKVNVRKTEPEEEEKEEAQAN